MKFENDIPKRTSAFKVTLCESCVDAGAQSGRQSEDTLASKFSQDLQRLLVKKDPECLWEVNLGPCQDICPSAQITIEMTDFEKQIDSEILVSVDSSIESVLETCIRFKDRSTSRA